MPESRIQNRVCSVALALTCACAGVVHAHERALLIGVSEYPYLARKNLTGPVNDLRLMTSTLRRLGVAASSVTELSESQGPAGWPTRDNILSALAGLALSAQKDDWVIVYFSGHGSQVPQSPLTRANYAEPDGLDEVFLPRDTRSWDADKRIVIGAITDDEVGAALAKITAKGARVWAIFDTCHAGDMLRSADVPVAGQDPVWRFIDPVDLKVPADEAVGSVLPGPPQRPALRPRPDHRARKRGLDWTRTDQDAAWVGFFASQADEGASEELMTDPEKPDWTARFGVFTHQLHQAVSRWNGSFANLATQVRLAYQNRPFPTPAFEGRLTLVPPFALERTLRAQADLQAGR